MHGPHWQNTDPFPAEEVPSEERSERQDLNLRPPRPERPSQDHDGIPIIFPKANATAAECRRQPQCA
jgi:hypothetical protein